MQTNMFQLSGIDQCIRVHGEDGMRAYSMGPNCRVPLFDDTDDILWVKSTDQNGFPSARKFRLTEEFDVTQKESGVALSDIRCIIREELGFNKEEMLNAQHVVPEPTFNDINATQSSEYDRSTASAKHHGNNSRNRQQRSNTSNVANVEKQQQSTGSNAAIGE